jgi:hypothetical protein
VRRRPGPPPKPTALRILEGNRSKRPLNDREPHPEPLVWTEPPAELAKAERGIWLAVVPHIAAGLMAQCDALELVKACRLEARGERFWRMKNIERGTRQGLRCWSGASAIWYRFGITPAERSRLRAEVTPKGRDKWAGLL